MLKVFTQINLKMFLSITFYKSIVYKCIYNLWTIKWIRFKASFLNVSGKRDGIDIALIGYWGVHTLIDAIKKRERERRESVEEEKKWEIWDFWIDWVKCLLFMSILPINTYKWMDTHTHRHTINTFRCALCGPRRCQN